ncbi:MAG TPA: AI-2E family transporter, partial [Candidatus Limnocylindria bacterium]
MARQHDDAGNSRAWLSRDAARTAATWAVVWLAFALLAWLAWQLKVILALVFVAILLAAAISQPVHLLERRLGLPRIAAVVACYLVLLAIAAGAVWLIVPPLVQQAAALVAAIPEISSRVIEWTREAVSPLVPSDAFDEALNALPARIGEVLTGQGVIGAPLVLIGIVVNVVIVVFLSAFLVIDGGSLWKAILGYAAPERRDRLSTVAGNVVDRLGSYVSGQLLIM